jgi:hypothetical protein
MQTTTAIVLATTKDRRLTLKSPQEPKPFSQWLWFFSGFDKISFGFKYCSSINLDVALEALKEDWMAKRLDLNLLAHYAQVCRVEKVMQLYLEMLVLRLIQNMLSYG